MARQISERIENFWFEGARIYIRTDKGNVYSRPFVVFPLLREATPEQREGGRIVMRGEALRWDEIDEDIHISSFYETYEPKNNEISEIFHAFPQLNVTQVAHSLGINYTLLSNYINGTKRPSKERVKAIKEGLRNLGNELVSI